LVVSILLEGYLEFSALAMRKREKVIRSAPVPQGTRLQQQYADSRQEVLDVAAHVKASV